MITIIIGALVVIGFVKVMWDIEATEKTVEVLTSKVLRLEIDKLTDKMVADVPSPKKKVTKKAVKRTKKDESK